MDRKLLKEVCREYIIRSVVNSKKLREKISFSEQVSLIEFVKSLSYKDVVSLIEYDGMKITSEQIRDFESKTKRALKYGTAAAIGGSVAGARGGYKELKKPVAKLGKKGPSLIGKVVKVPFQSLSKGLKGASIAVALMYLYRKISDPCVRKAIRNPNGIGRRLTKHQCQAEAAKRVIDSIKSEIPKCNDTKNPEKCVRKLEDIMNVWKKRYQKEITIIAKIKSGD